ncbi:non-homologous end-joining DNA ligase [Alicyclobacillus shizuokensis]|uniref:non-homologous end-joining DNA ligase n=1 Tax=Alicyclobacillus shizuokensis TaxID=392014 RepID=UPI0008340D10|nr:non-homologous end-joining DNA ligase [Alicyclobacillus shizuokensis]
MRLQSGEILLTNPDKLMWPTAGVTKLDYARYLLTLAPYMLPHLRQRPITMIRFPDGIEGPSFYQRDVPSGAPDWVRTVPVWSDERQAHIRYVLVENAETLLWLANLACLEFHIGFTRAGNDQEPVVVAFDLDPSVPGFEPVREVAMRLHELLSSLNIPHVAKTSGATGLQVFIPLTAGHTFAETRTFTRAVAQYLQQQLPRWVTLERRKRDRGDKVYIDYPQFGRHRTLIAPYSARATEQATVSAPVTWDELAHGACPEWFRIDNMPDRVQRMGDLMTQQPSADLREVLRLLARTAKSVRNPV